MFAKRRNCGAFAIVEKNFILQMKCLTCQKAIEDCNCSCFIFEYEEEEESIEPTHYLCAYCGIQFEKHKNNYPNFCCGEYACHDTMLIAVYEDENGVLYPLGPPTPS